MVVEDAEVVVSQHGIINKDARFMRLPPEPGLPAADSQRLHHEDRDTPRLRMSPEPSEKRQNPAELQD